MASAARPRRAHAHLRLPAVRDLPLRQRARRHPACSNEKVGFLEGRPVKVDEDSYYDLPTRSDETATVYEHCVRAIRHGLRFGEHGLPLTGSGDWNDDRETVYHIRVTNHGGAVSSVRVDGADQPDLRIPLVDDRRDHAVEIDLAG